MKTITIRDEIYQRLKAIKKEKESFSDVIKRLLERKNMNIERYFGILKDSPLMGELEEITRSIRDAARSRI